jgi:hypothetical protein
VVLIVARQRFGNLLGVEFAVIFGMQDFGEGIRIRGHGRLTPNCFERFGTSPR